MNRKTTRAYDHPVGTMEMNMVARGKVYRVVPSEIVNLFRGQESERIKNENPEWNNEKIDEEVDRILDDIGVGSSSCVYAKMTPEEQQRFDAQYRYGGVTRVWK